MKSPELIVRQQRLESDGVMSMILENPNGEELPPWQPGAHIDVVLDSGAVRQYSLCGDPGKRHEYRVAILKEVRGRGGSKEIHEKLRIGEKLEFRGPKNHFVMAPAEEYMLIAGGIGITPILSMARQATLEGKSWSLIYGGRSRASMAFLEEIDALKGGSVTVVPQDEKGVPDLRSALSSCAENVEIYCCGPEGLLRAVTDIATEVSCHERLHFERFTASAEARPREDEAAGGEELSEFEVELKQSDCVLKVPSDRSILDVVLDVNPGALFSCEEGFCGSCETKVLAGVPEHRDSILTPKDREKNESMMICVGRSRTPRLVLDA